ncbi:MAG: HAD family phosphatase [Victivallales bacterium]|nr:HAD family phosphatase [Victivallales bacterium]
MANLILCDIDGTLIRRGHGFSASTAEAMARLRAQGHYIALASGRNLWSCRQIIPEELPVSHWLFSTGVGVWDVAGKCVLRRRELTALESRRIAEVLESIQADYMVLAPLEDCPRFVYRRFGRLENACTDFDKRLAEYAGMSRLLAEGEESRLATACQFLIFLPSGDARLERLRDCLADDFTFVHSNSPYGGTTVWAEVFSRAAGKARAGEWLASQPDLDITATYALGNDFNDLDMLRWADHAMVTPNAPAALQAMFPVTQADTDGAFAEAVQRWGM